MSRVASRGAARTTAGDETFGGLHDLGHVVQHSDGLDIDLPRRIDVICGPQ